MREFLVSKYLVSGKRDLVDVETFVRGYCTPNQKLPCFVLLSQNYQHLLKDDLMHLKELKNGIQNYRPSDYGVIDQNIILTVLIHNLKPLGLLKFQCHFVSSLDNLL